MKSSYGRTAVWILLTYLALLATMTLIHWFTNTIFSGDTGIGWVYVAAWLEIWWQYGLLAAAGTALLSRDPADFAARVGGSLVKAGVAALSAAILYVLLDSGVTALLVRGGVSADSDRLGLVLSMLYILIHTAAMALFGLMLCWKRRRNSRVLALTVCGFALGGLLWQSVYLLDGLLFPDSTAWIRFSDVMTYYAGEVIGYLLYAAAPLCFLTWAAKPAGEKKPRRS